MAEYILNRVQELRTEVGETQELLAEKVGVSRQTVVAIERGHYTPSVLLALHIAKHFKVPVERVFSIAHE
jgi:putative transcriptional regulator